MIRLGNVEPDGAWVRRGEEPVAVRFEASVAALLTAGPNRFRDRTLVHEEAANARSITIRRGGVVERAVRGEGGDWRLEAPVTAEADRVVVREEARQMAELTAIRFVAERPAPEHGLSAPRLTVEVGFAADGEEPVRTVTLRVGTATVDGAYAQLAGDESVFELSRETLDALDAHLVSLDLLTVPVSEVAALRLEREGAPVAELRREGNGWQLPDGAAPDADRTRALMDWLSTLRASGVERYGAPDGTLGLEPPQVRARVTQTDGSQWSIDLGREQGEGEAAFVPARRSDLSVVYRFRPELVSDLLTYVP